MRQFERKVALITGGGGDIGRATALEFAQEGADIAVVDLNIDEAQQVRAEVEEIGQKALAIQADISKPEGSAQMIETTMQHFGQLNILFNNAGIGGESVPLDILPELPF